jgi:predicted nucleotidyltransferase
MSRRVQRIRITIKASARQVTYLKHYTRALGMKRWKRYLEEGALDVIPSDAEIQELEKQ